MSFHKDILAWAKKSEARITATYRRSIELLADEMRRSVREGGNLPFLTGNLSRSLLASTSAMPSVGGPKEEYVGQDVNAIAVTLTPKQTVWIGYQAIYARRLNYGFVGSDSKGRVYNQQGLYFVEKAIAEWPAIVRRAANEIKSSVN